MTCDLKEKWYIEMRRWTFVRMAWPSSSTERRRLPFGVSPIRDMFLRWAKGKVCDLFLVTVSYMRPMRIGGSLLHEIKDCHSVAHG